MKTNRILSIAAALTLALLLFVGFATLTATPPQADAATIIGQQAVTLLDGDTSYTTTVQTSAALALYYGEIVIQVNNDISGTGTITITPQTSIQNVACASVTDWADVSISTVYAAQPAGTTTITNTVTASTLNTNTLTTTVASTTGTAFGATSVAFGTANVSAVLTGDGNQLLRFPNTGRCFRVQIETSTTTTPTVYAWLLNTQ